MCTTISMLFTKFGVPKQNKLHWFILGPITVKNFTVSLIDIMPPPPLLQGESVNRPTI